MAGVPQMQEHFAAAPRHPWRSAALDLERVAQSYEELSARLVEIRDDVRGQYRRVEPLVLGLVGQVQRFERQLQVVVEVEVRGEVDVRRALRALDVRSVAAR